MEKLNICAYKNEQIWPNDYVTIFGIKIRQYEDFFMDKMSILLLDSTHYNAL